MVLEDDARVAFCKEYHLCRPGKDDIDVAASWNNRFKRIALLSRFVLAALRPWRTNRANLTRYRLS